MGSIDADIFVFDLEDAIAENNYMQALKNVTETAGYEKQFLRPRIFYNNNNLAETVFENLLSLGFTKIILPKVSSIQILKNIEKTIEFKGFDKNSIEVIILIEDPHGLIFAKEIIECSGLNIIGIGLGSHDYSKQMGMKHNLINLQYARSHIINIAKAYGIEAIDIASMNISDKTEFDEEIKTGFELGYDAKFIIHPLQLEWLKSYKYYSDSEIYEAKKIYSEIIKYNDTEFSVIKFNDKIIEKPHIKRIKEIIKWAEENEI